MSGVFASAGAKPDYAFLGWEERQIPAEAANKTPLAGWWTAHTGTWFAGIAVVWSAAMVTLASFRVKRWEE